MERPRAASIAGAASLAALLAAALLPQAAAAPPATAASGCALTTLDGTIRARDDGRLECAPGEPLGVRDDLKAPGANRAAQRDPLIAFYDFGELRIADEESPLRLEWADKCGEVPTSFAFRPQETMIPHLVNAHVRAANALASSGSPVLRAPYSFAVQLGNATDNRQANELRWAIDLLDGGGLLDPDSGADGYEGVQGRDPRLASPVDGVSVRDLANEPFAAAGLRAPSGAPLPWYAAIGNHDVKVQGTVPDDVEGWRAFAEAWATGTLKLSDVAPDQQQRVCEDPSLLADPAFWTSVATSPGATRVVAADPARDLLARDEWVTALRETTGVPSGHGTTRRCTAADGEPLDRACYAWDEGSFRFVVLDTAAAEGTDAGNLDAAQFAWLERDLVANSTRYFDEEGKRKTRTGQARMIVVLTHHSISTTTNEPQGEDVRTGADLEALLLRFPNVVLQVNAHAARNQVWAHEESDTETAYWEVSTASASEWPSQSRSIEIADNHDGTLSIFSVMVDAAAPPDARKLPWSQDPTDERALGAPTRVNEDWLAAAAREVAYNDPQANRAAAGDPEDRNVELVLAHPFGVTPRPRPILPPIPGIQPLPSFPLPSFPSFPSFPTFPTTPAPGFPLQPGAIPPPPTDGQVYAGGTGPGLSAKPGAAQPWWQRPMLFMIAAIAGGYWLARGRVRRFMVGI